MWWFCVTSTSIQIIHSENGEITPWWVWYWDHCVLEVSQTIDHLDLWPKSLLWLWRQQKDFWSPGIGVSSAPVFNNSLQSWLFSKCNTPNNGKWLQVSLGRKETQKKKSFFLRKKVNNIGICQHSRQFSQGDMVSPSFKDCSFVNWLKFGELIEGLWYLGDSIWSSVH